MSEPIVSEVEYARHIPVRCKNHTHLRWLTKNIAPFGCRSIFFDLEGAGNKECACSPSFLEPVPASEYSEKELEGLTGRGF